MAEALGAPSSYVYYESREALPSCAFCEGEGQIEGPFPLPCPKCFGGKKDIEAVRMYRGQRVVRRMGLIEEAQVLDTVEALDEQIRVRQQLKDQMVGWLYPSILEEEILRLRARRSRIKGY